MTCYSTNGRFGHDVPNVSQFLSPNLTDSDQVKGSGARFGATKTNVVCFSSDVRHRAVTLESSRVPAGSQPWAPPDPDYVGLAEALATVRR
jgi:hypothetical protein